jgi:hypothetical protein
MKKYSRSTKWDCGSNLYDIWVKLILMLWLTHQEHIPCLITPQHTRPLSLPIPSKHFLFNMFICLFLTYTHILAFLYFSTITILYFGLHHHLILGFMVNQGSSKNQKPRNPSYMEMKKSEGARETKDKNKLMG